MSPPPAPALSQTTPALLTLWKAYERTLYAHKATTALHTYSDTHPRISRGAMPSEPNLSRDRPPLCILTRRRGAHTAHTQIGRPTHEAPTRENTHKRKRTHSPRYTTG
eukprot:scaffold11230_cov69-Phaeocystis_antarctica.AAC.1